MDVYFMQFRSTKGYVSNIFDQVEKCNLFVIGFLNITLLHNSHWFYSTGAPFVLPIQARLFASP